MDVGWRRMNSIEALEKGLDWEDEEKDNMCLEDIIQTLIPFFLWLSVILLPLGCHLKADLI